LGGEQAAGTMRVVQEQRAARNGEAVDEAALDRLTSQIIENFNGQMDAFHTSARVLDDGIIDPRDTREVLALVMAICRDADRREPNPVQFAVARP
jgi:geranyl-CoA carboxylase beta subunit